VIVSSCNWLRLRVIVKEAVNKSNNPIQNPVIISHEAINTWQYKLPSIASVCYKAIETYLIMLSSRRPVFVGICLHHVFQIYTIRVLTTGSIPSFKKQSRTL
jgi:hypothetical protein